MKTKSTRRHFNPEFKKDAKTLVSERGYSISKAVEAVGTTANNLRRWIKDKKQEEGNYWDKVPTERFFGSLKREWSTVNLYPTREDAIADVRTLIAFYNSRKIHTTLGDLAPIEFEKCA